MATHHNVFALAQHNTSSWFRFVRQHVCAVHVMCRCTRQSWQVVNIASVSADLTVFSFSFLHYVLFDLRGLLPIYLCAIMYYSCA